MIWGIIAIILWIATIIGYVIRNLMVQNEISDWIQNAFSFDVTEGDFYGTGRQVSPSQSKVLMDFKVVYK